MSTYARPRGGPRAGSWPARARAASITARWPRCTPSKLPIATTAAAQGGGHIVIMAEDPH